MKKILLLLNDSVECEEVIDFAVKNVKKEGDVLVALFHQPYMQANIKKLFNGKPNSLSHSYYSIIDKILSSNKNISNVDSERILRKCIENKIQAKVNIASDSDKGLYQETIFADIILIGQQIVNKLSDDLKTNLFSIINKANCPVFIVPSNKRIENIVFVYDGSEASMNAIKFFNYILPDFYEDRRVYLLSTNDTSEDDLENADNLLIQYTRLHMPPVGYMRIGANNYNEITRFIKGLPQALFVVGALNDESLDTLSKGSVFINNESHLFIAK